MRTGSLSKWERSINTLLIKNKRNFIIKKRNGRRSAIYPSLSDPAKMFAFTYQKTLTKEEMQKIWLFGAVRKSFIKYVTANPKFEIVDNIPPVNKNSSMIKDLKPGQRFNATDASHCYWRMARNLKYITHKLYEPRATEEFKLIRNKALACCATLDKDYIFEMGEYVRTILSEENDYRLPLLYANVRFKSYELMRACMIACGPDHFLKYKIDCIYYLPGRQDEIESIFKANDMLFKTTECTYIGDGYFIEHDAEKDKVKRI